MSKYLMVFFVRSLLVVARRGIHTGSQSLIKMSRIPTLISGADALEMFSNNSAKFIDCSWHLSKERSARNEYKSRRIPGAQFFDIDDVSDHSTGLPHMLPSGRFVISVEYFPKILNILIFITVVADLFAGKVSKLGISSHDHVIVYASTGSFSSPRAWWMFRVFGHSKISIIDGGLEEWVRCGGSIEENEPTTEQVEGVFEAAYNPTLVKGWADVLQVVEDGSYQILDARSHARFVCEAPEPRYVPRLTPMLRLLLSTSTFSWFSQSPLVCP